LAKEFDESTNSVRIELNRLTDAGLLLAEDEGKTKIYTANQSHPFFNEIKGMVSKFLGLDDLLEKVVKRMGNVEKAIITGDYAMGVDSGVVELTLIGKNLDEVYLNFLIDKTYEKINRKVKVVILETDPGNLSGILVFGN
jgi:DNA-binding transcriptional ArsR family regulator